MTEQEINIAVSQACGWTHVRWAGCAIWGTKPNSEYSQLPDHWYAGCPDDRPNVPDYCHDLNAMWLVEEEHLLPAGIDEYAEHLYMVVEKFWTCERWVKFSRYSINHALSHATAMQRAEAFLRVKGLWKE